MLVAVGEYQYENIVTDEDFVDIIDEKISHEFACEIRKRLDWNTRQEELQDTLMADDFKFIEAENEELCNAIDDVNSILQNLVVPLERGARINRDKVIKTLNNVIKMLNDVRSF